MKEPLVSIIMPAYNAEKYIKFAIESVLAQNYMNWELLICDDASKDATKKIVNDYKNFDNRIKLISLEKNSGAAIARNQAIEKAVGDFIAFLDSDDVWFKEKLKKQVSFMIENNYDFSCTFYNKISSEGFELNSKIAYKSTGTYDDLLLNCPGNSTVIYNSKLLGKYYISDIRKRNDYLMWLQIIKSSKRIYCLEEILSSHRIIENSLSKKKSSLIKYHWYIYRKEENLSFFKSVKILSYWLFKGVDSKVRGRFK